jgi:hypothetical protein
MNARRTAFPIAQFLEIKGPFELALAQALTGRDPAETSRAVGGNAARLVGMMNANLNALSTPPAEPELPQDGDWTFESWIPFYRRHFPDQFYAVGGEDAINTSLFSPPKPGFGWPLLVLQGLTPNAAYAACERNFKCWRRSTQDLDAAVALNGREPTSTYGIHVRNRVEADEEYQDLSANDVAVRGIAGTTLLERELLELKYWHDTQRHLDLGNVTLCTGSRFADGSVPGAYWNDGGFGVTWRDPAGRVPGLRVREVSV